MQRAALWTDKQCPSPMCINSPCLSCVCLTPICLQIAASQLLKTRVKPYVKGLGAAAAAATVAAAAAAELRHVVRDGVRSRNLYVCVYAQTVV
jgi:hypothetical protein